MDHDPGFRIGYFGDVRRERAGAEFFERVVTTGSLVISEVGGNRAGEISAHRFLDSQHVTAEEISNNAGRRTAAACTGRRIIAVQDTTEINFSGRDRGRRGLGPAGDGKSRGFFCHTMVAVDIEDEALVGLVHAHIWTRPSKRAPARRSQRIEHKESIRWIDATAAAAKLLDNAAQLIVVGDREFDIYSQFVRRPANADLLVRVAQNRNHSNGDRLFDAPSRWHASGTMDVRVASTGPGDPGRLARVSVRAGTVCIAKPRHGDRNDPMTVTLTYIEVRENNPPAGRKAIIWRLLT